MATSGVIGWIARLRGGREIITTMRTATIRLGIIVRVCSRGCQNPSWLALPNNQHFNVGSTTSLQTWAKQSDNSVTAAVSVVVAVLNSVAVAVAVSNWVSVAVSNCVAVAVAVLVCSRVWVTVKESVYPSSSYLVCGRGEPTWKTNHNLCLCHLHCLGIVNHVGRHPNAGERCRLNLE